MVFFIDGYLLVFFDALGVVIHKLRVRCYSVHYGLLALLEVVVILMILHIFPDFL